MNRPIRNLLVLSLFAVAAVAVTGCQTFVLNPTPTITPMGFIETSVFETAEAAFTQTAQAAPPTFAVETPSPTAILPGTGADATATLAPAPTEALPTPTNVVIVSPTPEPSPTAAVLASPTAAEATQPVTSPQPSPTAVQVTPAAPTQTQAPAGPTPTVIVQTPGVPPTGGQVILEDNFETNQAWFITNTTDFRMGYANDGYRMLNNFRDSFISSIRSFNRTDVYMEVDAMQISGPDTGWYGLVCRWQDVRNHYGFVLGADGSYAIVRNQNGEVTFLAQGDLDDAGSENIDTGLNETNRIGASCRGSTLALYVNDRPLLQVQDSTWTSGLIGLTVLTETGAVEAHFDNFLAVVP